MDIFLQLSALATLAGALTASLTVVRRALPGSAGLCPVPTRGLRRPRTDSRGRM